MSEDSPNESVASLTPATAPAIEATNVSKSFGATQALSNVSIQVQPGEIRALVGRNGAGKSSLVGVLTGLTKPDTGEVRFVGRPAPRLANRGKWREEVACVYQHAALFPELSVAENLFVNDEKCRGFGLVDWRATARSAQAILRDWSLDVSPDAAVADLTIEQRKILEIARGVSKGAKVLLLDEPTAQLESHEARELFGRLRRLKAQGIAVIYISHYLQEIFDLCDTVTVLRDGQVVFEGSVDETDELHLVKNMVGDRARLQEDAKGGSRAPGVVSSESESESESEPVLRIDQLRVRGRVNGVSFSLRPGECVGLAGLPSAGKQQVADAIAGLVKADGGRIEVAGQQLGDGRPRHAIACGVGYVPQDRHFNGMVQELGIDENCTMTVWDRLGAWGLIRPHERRVRAMKAIRTLQIVGSPTTPVADLSGGNQQKVVMARALASGPKVLVLVDPGAGVDVSSKSQLFDAIDQARSAGTAVVIVSDQLDELALADRVLVMVNGSIVNEFKAGWSGQELIAAIEDVESHAD